MIRLCGDGTEKALAALAGLPVEAPPALLAPTNALAVAMCAEEQLQAGGELSDLALSPVYLRKPQAEREREERLAREKQQQ